VRWEACSGLEHLGVRLDRERNDSNADTISTPDPRCLVRVIPTNEDLMIARHTHELIFS
jgi:acetate kinase